MNQSIETSKVYYLKPKFSLSLMILVIFSKNVYSTELNLNFLHGTKSAPTILTTDTNFPSGLYYVDLSLNQKHIGRYQLEINKEEEKNNMLCLSPDWLNKSGVFFVKDKYKEYYDEANSCYRLGKEPHTSVVFDYGSQSLNFNIPQAYLLSENDGARWDYGINGLRLKYNANFNQNSDNEFNAFANFDALANIGRWVLSSRMNLIKNNNDGHQFETNDVTLSTAISSIKGDLLLGRAQTRSNLFTDVGFYGVSLRSNSNMTSWDNRGYAPIISGVANSTSRVTVKQGGYTIYSEVVPAGPYQITNLSSVSNGDLVVTVEDDSGKQTETIYPVSTLPTLLRPNEIEYNFVIGQRDHKNKLTKDVFSDKDNLFGMVSLGYGLNYTTLNSAFILNNKYQATGIGVTQSLGYFGALSSNLTVANANYDNEDNKVGQSVGLNYTKSFTNTTDLQLLAYRHQSKNYIEFADFRPGGDYSLLHGSKKARYEANISHRFSAAYIRASVWNQSYWNRDNSDTGVTLLQSLTLFDDVTLNLTGDYYRRALSKNSEYSIAMTVNVPFTLGGTRYTNSSGITYNRQKDVRFNSGVSAVVNENLNYNIQTSLGNRNDRAISANMGYGFDVAQTNLGATINQDRSSINGGISGTALISSKTGLLLTKETSSVIGIANIKDLSGVTFNNSLPTDSRGNAVLYLSEYTPNEININMDNVPDNVEINNTTYNVVPTDRAIIYREFGFESVQRYIFQIKDKNGYLLKNGNALTDTGLDAGFVTKNGVLLVNLLAVPKRINIELDNEKTCSFSLVNILANTNKVQEVVCE